MANINVNNPASPAVIKREIDFTSIVDNTIGFNAAYVGAYPWGPACQPTVVTGVNDFVSKFGEPKEFNTYHHFAVEDYMAYASPVCLTRVVDEFTYNAYSGNTGIDFEGTAQVINGEIVGVTYVNFGSGYSIGDIIPVSTTHDVVVQAVLQVSAVDPTGAITDVVIVEAGRGYTQDDVLSAVDFTIQVKNEDDFLLVNEQGCNGILEGTTSLNALYPSIIARYPGANGNQILFSTARASEFDSWEYSSVFSVPPAADVATYDVVDGENVINIDPTIIANFTSSDYVITLNGVEIREGISPGDYTVDNVANTITLNVDTETFTSDGINSEYTLANVFNIPTTNAIVSVNGVELETWEGDGVIPRRRVRIEDNVVTFGNDTALTSGDGINTNYLLNFGQTPIDVMNDLRVFVGGVEYVITTAQASGPGEVQAIGTTGLNYVVNLNFHPTDIPPDGINNIVGYTNFLENGDTIEVSYNYPENGELKVFSNQTEIHAIVATADGTFGTEAGEILEAYSFLSLEKGTKTFDGSLTYYKDVLNKTSQYVWASNDLTVFTTLQLSRGTDSLMVGNEEIIQGWQDYYSDPEEKQFTYVIGGAADTVLANWLIDNILECRCDSIGAFSPRFSDVVCTNGDRAIDNAIEWRGLINATSYAVTEGNWKLRYDQYTDTYRWLPLSQDTLGIIAASNQTNGTHVSPAGTTRGRYKNVVRLAYNPTRAQRDRLYPNDINPVYNVENIGSVLYGDRTLIGRNSAFREIAVRMLFIDLEYNLAVAARGFKFEQNNEFTRRRVFNTLNPFLRNRFGNGDFDEYRLIVDETNNTADVINNQTMCINVLLRPNRSINFICMDFTATRFGLTFDEVIEGQRLNQILT